MKTILVPHTSGDGLESVLRCALLVAERFSSRIQALHIRRMIPTIVSEAGGVMLTMEETMEADEADSAAAAQKIFQSAMRKAGVGQASKGSAKGSSKAASKVAAQWRESPERGADLGGHARLFDLVVCGRPGQSVAATDMGTFESMLFESGRPILIAPMDPPKSLGETVVIAWNGSTESARTISFAAPFLQAAKKIFVLTVDGGMVRGPDGAELTEALSLGGLKVEHRHVATDQRSVGEAILEETASLGCDLLIKGAYTHSRLRQMIFGGPTSHVLANAELPVFVAH